MGHGGVRLLAFSVLVPCLVAPALSQPRRLSPLYGEVRGVAERLASELHAGSELRLSATPRGRVGFLLGGVGEEGQPAPILYVQGAAIGSFVAPQVMAGVAGEYRVPQMLVGVAHLDPKGERVRCGHAVLEPTARDQEIGFGGLRRLDLGEAGAHAYLCGVVLGVEDRYGGVAEGEGDGSHEVLVRLHAVDRRAGADPPPVLEEVYLLDLGGAEPRVLERVSSEVSELELEHLPLYLEYSGIDEVRIVGNFDYGRGVPIDLPPELARLEESIPGLRIVRVTKEEGTTTFVGRVWGADRDTLQQVVQVLKKQGLAPRELSYFIADGEALPAMSLTYGKAPPSDEGGER